MPVRPNFLIVNLNTEEWLDFLRGDKTRRINIIRPYIKKPGPSEIFEIAWIPLENLVDSELMELEQECKHCMKKTNF